MAGAGHCFITKGLLLLAGQQQLEQLARAPRGADRSADNGVPFGFGPEIGMGGEQLGKDDGVLGARERVEGGRW